MASERALMVGRFVEFIQQHGLGTFVLDSGVDGRCRYIVFGVPRVLDATMKIYSEKFIQISYATAYGHLPRKDNRVFETENAALEFLKAAFVEKSVRALEIPTKAS